MNVLAREVRRSYQADTADPGLLAWARRYLSDHFRAPAAPFHRELEAIAAEERRAAIAAPRGHAKSTLLSLAYPLYRAAVHREPYTLILSDSREQAAEHVGNIFSELLHNDRLTAAYPHLRLPEYEHYRRRRVKRTAADFITVAGHKFIGKGSGSRIRGARHGHQRPTLVICDDLENDQHVENERQRTKMRRWFLKSVSNLPGAAGGQILVIGTILHRESLLAWLLSEQGPAAYRKAMYRALREDGEPLWADEWTHARLDAKRAEIGSRAFSGEYLNEPVDEESTLWKAAWIDDNRRTRAPQLVRLAVAVDPSANDENGDQCGIIVGGRCSARHGYVLEDCTRQASPAQWARAALDAYERHQADYIVAEKNQGGDMIRQVFRSVLAPGEKMPRIRLVWASRGKQTRADPVAALYERGRIHHVGHLPALERQLCSWIPGMPSPNRLDANVWLWAELLAAGKETSDAAQAEGLYR